jgi:hypothetical protein
VELDGDLPQEIETVTPATAVDDLSLGDVAGSTF